ncbi:hypothetical protein [Nocardiopsis ganjiahuensis]|uniref:hypothetical protein n=1 Tax=Nocardiopsis ganjiahuensis TaxID=239984 RepID=UPI0003463BCA|nr:hypothetical protein [Nocardiopsis ganjiahuensis]
MLSPNAHALLRAVLRDLPGDHHILTLNARYPMSTAVDRRGEAFEVEHPEVAERLYTAFTGDSPAALVLRTFTDRTSHTLPHGVAVPVKLVRGWRLGARSLIPLDEAEMFDAHCTDSASGEPLPPERGVEYTSAPVVELPAFDHP